MKISLGKWSSRVLAALFLIVLAGGIVLALRPRPTPVETATAATGPLEQKVVDDGHARVRERYTVSAPVAGTLARIELHEGDTVEPGSVLARLLPLPSPLLDPRAREVAVQHVASSEDSHHQAHETLQRAEEAASDAHRDLDRMKHLSSHGAATRAQLDAAVSEARIRDTEVQSARFAELVLAHGIDEARAALETFASKTRGSDQLLITSPVHGKVLHVIQKSEAAVAAGTALVEVGDPAAIELVVDVLSQDAVEIHAGMPARAIHWGGDASLSATVRRVEPAAFTRVSALGVEEQRVNVLLDLDGAADQWQALGDGFAAEIEITNWSRPSVLQIPTSALFRQASGWAAFVLRDGRAVALSLEIGHRGPLQTEVTSGLTAGERVIIHPGATVRDGAAVEAR